MKYLLRNLEEEFELKFLHMTYLYHAKFYSKDHRKGHGTVSHIKINGNTVQ